tara:strand:+ start:336 stop:557 length:222 start_codon:yes stop_codon:yes gene_type:complete
MGGEAEGEAGGESCETRRGMDGEAEKDVAEARASGSTFPTGGFSKAKLSGIGAPSMRHWCSVDAPHMRNEWKL